MSYCSFCLWTDTWGTSSLSRTQESGIIHELSMNVYSLHLHTLYTQHKHIHTFTHLLCVCVCRQVSVKKVRQGLKLSEGDLVTRLSEY